MEFLYRVINPLEINVYSYHRCAHHTTQPDPSSSPVNIRFLLRKCDQFLHSTPDSISHAVGVQRIAIPSPVTQTFKSFPRSLFSSDAPAADAIRAQISKALSTVLFWPVARELDQGTRDAILEEVVDKVRQAVAQGLPDLEVEISMTVNYVGAARRRRDHRMKAEVAEEELLQKEAAVEGQICVVCLGDLSEATRMPCSHSFHGECIRRWLERSHTCPVCRYEMPMGKD